MRLSIAEIKKQSEKVVIENVLQSIQGGSNEDCHCEGCDNSLYEGLQEIHLPPSGIWQNW